jgi:two-component sensor histidine kinase
LHSVVAIDSLADSGVWIASYDGLLFRDDAAADHRELADILPGSVLADGNIMTITVDAQGLWIGYRATGLQYVPFADVESPYFWRTGDRSSLSSNSVSAILPHEDGRTLIGTYGGGVNIVSLTADTEVFPVGDNNVIFLHRTLDGTILAGTESGLYRLDVDTGQADELKLLETYGSGQTTPVVWDLLETSNGDTWLATMHHGLFVSKDEISTAISERTFVPVTESTNFCSIAYAIEEDNQGYIWCSTNSALVRVDPISHETRVFSRSQGLELSEFDFGASHKDEDGYLYFGGSEGYVKFDPQSIKPVQGESALAFTSIKMPGSNIISMSILRNTESVQLTHKDRFIQFEFSVMDLVDPENNQYRYRLEGFDQAWVENGNRNSATYTSLPAGRYTLHVQGANSAGVWNRDGLSIEVEVLPAPWWTWWAFTLYALALLFITWLFLRTYWSFALQRASRLQRRQMLEAEQHADDEMQEQLEIHDELVKSVYRHSVSTLGLVAELISTKGAHLADETACEVMRTSVSRVDALAMLEECLYYQGEVLLADLNKYTNILVSRLLKHSPVGAENITTTNDVTSRPFPVAQASPLAIVLFEAIENAIQYAFEDTSRVNYLHITLGPDQADDPDANFRLVVRDNGPGIPPNIDPMSAPSSGLLIVASMARKLRGTVRVVNKDGTVLTLVFPRDPAQ